MGTWAEASTEHYAVRSDGAKFKEGVRDDTLDTSWLSFAGGVLSFGPGRYSEVLMTPRIVAPKYIVAWWKQRSPFFDPDPTQAVDASRRPLWTLNNQVRIDEQGVRVRKAGATVDTTRLDQEGLTVVDELEARQVVVGEIAGLPGVPASVAYGLWGKLNSGVYIQGAPRLVASGGYGYTFGVGGQNANSTKTYVDDEETIFGAFTVPAGKKWIFHGAVSELRMDMDILPIYYMAKGNVSQEDTGGGGGDVIMPVAPSGVIEAGDYLGLTFRMVLKGYAAKQQDLIFIGGGAFLATYTILEIDA